MFSTVSSAFPQPWDALAADSVKTKIKEQPNSGPLDDWSKLAIDVILLCWHRVPTYTVLTLVAKNFATGATFLAECPHALDNYLTKLLHFFSVYEPTSSTIKQCLELFVHRVKPFGLFFKCESKFRNFCGSWREPHESLVVDCESSQIAIMVPRKRDIPQQLWGNAEVATRQRIAVI